MHSVIEQQRKLITGKVVVVNLPELYRRLKKLFAE